MTPDKVLIPEVIEPDEALTPDLIALRRFAWLMDEAVAVPGTGRRVGLDAAIGLIPGVGDVIGGVMSAWIIIAALRHRVPASKIGRMMFNVLADVIIGSIPVLGDIFDFLFEENVMNLQLLLRYRNRREPPRTLKQIGIVAAAILAALLVVSLVAIAALVALVIWLIGKR